MKLVDREKSFKRGCGLSDMEKLDSNTVGLRPGSRFGRSGWGQDGWPE